MTIVQPVLSAKNDQYWTLVENFNYSWTFEDRTFSITVNKGFLTDLASVPKIFWPIVAPFGLVNPAAVLHDALYQGNGNILPQDGTFTLNDQPFTKSFSRDECDRLFLRLCRLSGVPSWRSQVMYWSLKGFGFVKWNQYSKKLKVKKNEQ